MKKLLVTILTALSLQGCMYQTVNSYDIARANYYCKGSENVVQISSSVSGVEIVTCLDGSKEVLDNVKIVKG